MSKNITKKTQTAALYFSVIIMAIASIFWVNGLILAWTAPTAVPPGSNVAAPLNVGSTGQSKAGGLILNTGGATTGLIVDSGNVGIGTAAPASKLQVAGTIHSTSGGIKFPDNTVQATAVTGGGMQMKTGTYTGNGVDNRNIDIGVNLSIATYKWIVTKGEAPGLYCGQKFGHETGDVSDWFHDGGQTSNTIQAWTTTGFQLGTYHQNASGYIYNYVVFWQN